MSKRAKETVPWDSQRAPSVPRRRITRDLARAESLAMMLASSRASNIVEVSDLLAGMFLDDWERLSKFWEDPEEVETLLQQMCRISDSRWNYWLQHYHGLRDDDGQKRSLPWRLLHRKKSKPASDTVYQRSSELEEVLRHAEGISPFRDKVGGRSIPILTRECVLLCIAKHPGLMLGRKLIASGIDLGSLERAARFPKRGPLH
jgi:hypothetical protein